MDIFKFSTATLLALALTSCSSLNKTTYTKDNTNNQEHFSLSTPEKPLTLSIKKTSLPTEFSISSNAFNTLSNDKGYLMILEALDHHDRPISIMLLYNKACEGNISLTVRVPHKNGHQFLYFDNKIPTLKKLSFALTPSKREGSLYTYQTNIGSQSFKIKTKKRIKKLKLTPHSNLSIDILNSNLKINKQ